MMAHKECVFMKQGARDGGSGGGPKIGTLLHGDVVTPVAVVIVISPYG